MAKGNIAFLAGAFIVGLLLASASEPVVTKAPELRVVDKLIIAAKPSVSFDLSIPLDDSAQPESLSIVDRLFEEVVQPRWNPKKAKKYDLVFVAGYAWYDKKTGRVVRLDYADESGAFTKLSVQPQRRNKRSVVAKARRSTPRHQAMPTPQGRESPASLMLLARHGKT